MSSFKDNTGRTWSISLNVHLVESLKRDLGLDLMTLLDGTGEFITQLNNNPLLLCGVLWYCVKDTDQAGDMTPESFGQSLGGSALQDGLNAFFEAVPDFFPNRRELLKAVIEKTIEAEKIQSEKMIAAVNSAETAAFVEKKCTETADDYLKNLNALGEPSMN